MNNYFNEAIKTIQNWVQIKSVKTESLNNKPFGENVYKMLIKALEDAKNLGFEVKNYDNYIGEVSFGDGEDKDGLAILCHLDVVPEGDVKKWNYDPYCGVIKDGKIFGRGVCDDKGPAVLCLYALKELKDGGFIPNRKIKLILGCDEESGWGCIEHYNKVAVMPDEGFSPDGDFPVIYAEKGILHIEYTYPISNKIVNAYGGERVNMVCDCATVECDDKIFFKSTDKDVFIKENKIIAKGITAHGSTPQEGDNALKKLLKVLVDNNLIDVKIYNNLFNNESIFKDVYDQTGNLTFSPNVISYEKGNIKIKVDVRYPATFKKEDIENKLKTLGKYKEISYQPPLINDKNGKLVTTLLKIYNDVFNDNKKPITIGGGTYARALVNGVAFGPCAINESIPHKPNEYLEIYRLQKCYIAYKMAIEELCK